MFRWIRTLFAIVVSLVLATSGYAQPFGTGAVLDPELYNQVPEGAPLMRGDYDDLPERASLKPYAPTPKSQGQTGTCTAWSTAYAARTILLAQSNGWTDKSVITRNAMSPSYVYNQIRRYPGCDNGTAIPYALDLIKREGVAKLTDFPFICSKSVTSQDRTLASENRILTYKRLRYFKNMIPVKKSLSEGKPVVIGMDCLQSFSFAKGVWSPTINDRNRGGHAMVVVGYDDNMYGGAVEIMNSWGTGWGNKGFIWVKYSDFTKYTREAYEVTGLHKPKPSVADLSGTMKFQQDTGELMTARLSGDRYVMNKPYASGTSFTLFISNNQPAYVYAFGSDLTNKSFRIFPHNTNVSAHLGYKKNNVAIPDEDHFIRMDDNVGTDFFCVLYSRESLDLEDIMTRMEQTTGSFMSRLKRVLGSKLVSTSNITYKSGEIDFSAFSRGSSVVPLVVEIEHTN